MNKKLKKQWARALRSGEYEQGQSELCYIDKEGVSRYCCLGVLADIAIDGYWEYDEQDTPEGDHDVSYSLHSEGMPGTSWDLSSYLIKLGLPSPIHSMLVKLNDEQGDSFSDIANWIEAQDF